MTIIYLFFIDDMGAKPNIHEPAGTCFVANQNRVPLQSETLKREIYADVTSVSQYAQLGVSGREMFALSPHLSSLSSITQVSVARFRTKVVQIGSKY